MTGVQSAAASATRSRRRLLPPLVLLGTVAAGALVLTLRDPHVAGSYGVCPSALLGIACPGCGGLRGSYELVHGDLVAAWLYNPLVVLGAAAALALLLRWLADLVRGRDLWRPSDRLGVALAVALLVFWVARNLPGLSSVLGPHALG